MPEIAFDDYISQTNELFYLYFVLYYDKFIFGTLVSKTLHKSHYCFMFGDKSIY